jgi:DNA-binding NarL/FixJ family response regulator
VRGELPSRARQRLIAAGAAAVIPAAEADEMLDAARVLCAAGYLVVAPGARPSGAALSAREKQVLALVALGLSNAEIANELVVSEHTVKSHVSAALAKLGARSRSEAAQLVLDPDSGVGAGVLRITPQAQGDDQGAAGEGDASGAWLRT